MKVVGASPTRDTKFMRQTKTCWQCQTVKSVDEFGRNKARKDGCQTECKQCRSSRHQKYYQKNKKKYHRYNAQHRQTNRDFIAAYLADKQCECGFSDSRALDFDHIDPTTKKKEISKMLNQCYSIEAIKAEIAKCRILCANCHRIHTAIQQKHNPKKAP